MSDKSLSTDKHIVCWLIILINHCRSDWDSLMDKKFSSPQNLGKRIWHPNEFGLCWWSGNNFLSRRDYNWIIIIQWEINFENFTNSKNKRRFLKLNRILQNKRVFKVSHWFLFLYSSFEFYSLISFRLYQKNKQKIENRKQKIENRK